MVDGIQPIGVRMIHPAGWDPVFDKEVNYFLHGEVRGCHSASPRARYGECRPRLGHEGFGGVRGVVLLDPFPVSAGQGAQASKEPSEDQILAVGPEGSQQPVAEH